MSGVRSGCGASIIDRRCSACGRLTLLDLFSCAGGAAMGYHCAGFCVTGVDHEEQPNYPFHHVVADALLFGAAHGHEFAAIHTSPPCQRFTAYRRKGHGVGEGYLNLIPETRSMLERIGRPWVIENVEQARVELCEPVKLCGSAFGLDVQRHRLFESSVELVGTTCDHNRPEWTPRFAPASNRTNLRKTVEIGVWRIPLPVQQRAMGIDWTTLEELSEAIPPAYTEYLGAQLLAVFDVGVERAS